MNFLDRTVRDFVTEEILSIKSEKEKAKALYYKVRDEIRYDPYHILLKPEFLRASEIVKRRYGFCVEKALLLAAVSRLAGIPSKIGFANVRNHISSPRLSSLMKTDIFVYHGYTEMFIEGKWVKCTPAFNKSLCDRAGIFTLEFDGENNSLFHPLDLQGKKHMEYLQDFGTRDDLPYQEMMDKYAEAYPHLDVKETGTFGPVKITAKFEDEV
ncbi:MAG TPA: transglutaminase-like domain-containing protein [Leptospiraceae bacterium]|nr:transglutaminase-like domain-containing protein [Leptospiraceae bacterium]HNM03901.1 transglutaminase-like domain-containing protein [Leptospiraceae bacterium]HNN06148.1 transglutaminase-like domain-containing protein [Leptospiraceae bacterium]